MTRLFPYFRLNILIIERIYKSLKHRIILNSTFIDVSITLFITVTSVTLALLKFREKVAKVWKRSIFTEPALPKSRFLVARRPSYPTTLESIDRVNTLLHVDDVVSFRKCDSRRWPDVRNVYLVNRTSMGVRYLFIIRVNIIVIQTTAINS